jgi:hypothetical protein
VHSGRKYRLRINVEGALVFSVDGVNLAVELDRKPDQPAVTIEDLGNFFGIDKWNGVMSQADFDAHVVRGKEIAAAQENDSKAKRSKTAPDEPPSMLAGSYLTPLPGAAQQSGWMAPPSGGMALPGGMALQSGGMALPGGVAPQSGGMALQSGGVAPQSGGMALQSGGMAPQSGAMAPQSGLMAPPSSHHQPEYMANPSPQYTPPGMAPPLVRGEAVQPVAATPRDLQEAVITLQQISGQLSVMSNNVPAVMALVTKIQAVAGSLTDIVGDAAAALSAQVQSTAPDQLAYVVYYHPDDKVRFLHSLLHCFCTAPCVSALVFVCASSQVSFFVRAATEDQVLCNQSNKSDCASVTLAFYQSWKEVPQVRKGMAHNGFIHAESKYVSKDSTLWDTKTLVLSTGKVQLMDERGRKRKLAAATGVDAEDRYLPTMTAHLDAGVVEVAWNLEPIVVHESESSDHMLSPSNLRGAGGV